MKTELLWHRRLAAVAALAVVFIFSGCSTPVSNPRVVFPNSTINGQPVRVALDTGAAYTAFLSETAAQRLGVRFTSLDNMAATDPVIGLSDPAILTVGTESITTQIAVSGFSGYDVLIGWPALQDAIFVFDGSQHTVSAVAELPAETAGWLQLKINTEDITQLSLDIPLSDGTTGAILVDTGDPGGVVLPAAKWEQWRAAHPLAHIETVRGMWGIPGVSRTVPEAQTDEIKLGPLTLTNMEVRKSGDTGDYGLVGDNFIGSLGLGALARMDLVVDSKNGVAYVRPNPVSGIGETNAINATDANQDWRVIGPVRLQSEVIVQAATELKTLVGLSDRLPKELNDGDWDAAITDLDAAIAFDTASDPADVPEAYVVRGLAWEGKGDDGRAFTDFNQALKLDPQNADAYYFRGIAWQNKGDFSGALADYDKAIELKPDKPNKLHAMRLSRQLLQLRLGKAPADFAQTIAGWPNSWLKTESQFVAGELNEIALLAEAEKPGNMPVPVQQGEAYYYIGMMRLFKGDKAGARDFFQKCVAGDTKMADLTSQLSRAELARLDAAEKK